MHSPSTLHKTHPPAGHIAFQEYDLDNGLHVIVHSNRTLPIVHVGVLYHVGSKNDPRNRAGFAHFFEHLLFEGSKYVGRGKFSQLVQQAGGQYNAYTCPDHTYYYEDLPAHHLELGLYLESERMLHAKVDQIGVDIQKDVVQEEFKQRYERPYQSVYLHLFQESFPHHPYGQTTIGNMEHIRTANLEEVQDFYTTYYTPQNATLVIAGDVAPARAYALARKYFGDIPRGKPLLSSSFTPDPLPTQERALDYWDAIPLPAIYSVYRTSSRKHADCVKLYMLSHLLGSGRSALLYKHLVQDTQLASHVFSFAYPMEEDGLLVLGAHANTHVRLEDLQEGLDRSIQEACQAIGPATLARLKTQYKEAFVYETMAEIGEALALAHIYDGGAHAVHKNLERCLEVTPADIQNTALHYLHKESRLMLRYLPKQEGTSPAHP